MTPARKLAHHSFAPSTAMPSRPPASVKLPPLPFGNDIAEVHTDIKRFGERMATVVTSLNEYAATGNPNEFASKTVMLRINGLKLVASANSPVVVDVGSSHDTTLMIPFSGKNISRVGKIDFAWQAQQAAMFIPAVGRGGGSGIRSSLMVDIDPTRLQNTARAMLGYADSAKIDLRVHEARLLSLRSAQYDFESIFRHVSSLIDSVQCDTAALSHLGVDDLIYRAIVMMLRQDLFLDPLASRASGTRRRELDPVCDFILANLGEAISLSDLERISMMSARSLQYAFQQRFGCTPMQWVREERLLMARRQLQNIHDGETIATIAINCGFINQGAFSAYYRQRFGELPSDTVGKAFAQQRVVSRSKSTD